MLSILIIDDTPEKIKAIKDVIQSSGIQIERLDIAVCVNQAIQQMHEHQYDLSLLDFYIPLDWDLSSVPDPKNAINLLNEIAFSEEIFGPVRVLAITKAKQIEQEHKDLLEKSNCILLTYSEESDIWKGQLKKELMSLKNLKAKFSHRLEYQYDVAIITALQRIESDQLRKVFGGNWEALEVEGDDTTTYYTSELEVKSGVKIRVVTCYQQLMASISCSMLTTKVIANFHPRYLFMTGIAASVKTADEGVGYGDVLVATEVWNAANGKIKESEEETHLFMPDYRHEVLDAGFENIITKLMEEKQLLYDISEAFPSEAGKPYTKLQIHKGPMASVPAVVACEKVVNDLKAHDRNLLGIEMESYGLFYASAKGFKPRPIYTASLKSVSDYGTKEKCDKYQEYAAYTSAAVLKHIVENYLKFD